MSRVDVIAGAIQTYCADVDSLPTSSERVQELARFIDGHLAADSRPVDHPAVLALRMVKAQVDEALKPTWRSVPPIHPRQFDA